jgi:hypothetical protein
MTDKFDAVIHIDETRAVEPIERTARREEGELPETYPYPCEIRRSDSAVPQTSRRNQG